MNAWWLTVPLAPIIALLLVFYARERALSAVWLCCLPALILACWPPAGVSLPYLWPGATWGGDDLATRTWLAFTAFLWICAAVFALGSQRLDPRKLRFWSFWLVSLSGNLLLIIAHDGISFYVGFTVMSLAAYGLVVHVRGPAPRQAARVYLQLAVLGEMLLYAGLLLRFQEAGFSLAFDTWRSAPISALTASLLLVGFGIKAGFWPLHMWLPLAHPAAPAAASAVLSGAMIKAGILGLWRTMPESDPLLLSWVPWLIGIALFSAFYGVALGLLQSKIKAVLAYSSISQVSYLFLILALSWYEPMTAPVAVVLLALFTAHHGLAKGALFLGAGIASRYRLRPYHWVLMALPALALTGLPFTSGAAVKGLLKEGVGNGDFAFWLPVLIAGSTATGLLVFRALWLMYRAQATATMVAPPLLVIPWALLCLMPLALPWLWSDLRAALLHSLTLYTSWSLFWPLLIALILAALVIRLGWNIPQPLARLPNPARYFSLRLKRLLQRPPLPPAEVAVAEHIWRKRERRWNRFWQQGTVRATAWLLCVLLLLGWVW